MKCFTRGNILRNHVENDARDFLDVDVLLAAKLLPDPFVEVFLLSNAFGLSGWVPTLVIRAAHEQRQLRPEGSRLGNAQPVAQHVQDCSQCAPRPVPVVPVQPSHDVRKPCVRLVHRRVEGIVRAHVCFLPILS